jgi:hypothetical protein
VLSPIAWLANKLYAIEENTKEVANAYRMDLVYCLAQRCKRLFSATITLPDLTRINLYTELWVRGCRAVSKLVKTALNTAITVKLLKSKVTYMRKA